ncbi:MAG TPA: Rad52/Rad22 family DNA repair protein [Deltaproteobacteria bacterium]|nr:recombinase [Deltaproteobacteria bacterium]HQO81115.1 Rad52/Rad22 family DNA repair protein [Deltaproteobacteria bacterium]HQQ16012.1 Rad52/Rad22 family DNA repair protein [Deltaproteobacteria bacterium]
MSKEINLCLLKEPFPPEDIEWREQRNGVDRHGRPWAMVLAYVTNRAIQNRLDAVCGLENWKNQFIPGPNGGVLCGISIRVGGEWITKWDGADNTDIESVKGGLSDAMKRAAVQWGIGRYLYNLEATFAQIDENGMYRGVAYASDSDRKARKNPVYFRWNPPALPDWALPQAKGQSEDEPSKAEGKKKTKPKSGQGAPPITAGEWDKLQHLMKNAGVSPADFLKKWKVSSPRELRRNLMPKYEQWVHEKTA